MYDDGRTGGPGTMPTTPAANFAGVGEGLRFLRHPNAATALGLAVSHLMTRPAFANLRFGHWSRVLVGQINRGHYVLVLRGDRVVGFAGWALTDAEKAEGWITGRRELRYDESGDGDHVVFNAWEAADFAVHRFLLDGARRIVSGRRTIYFKRYYDDGRIRPVRFSVNAFLDRHITRMDGVHASRNDG